MKRDEVALVLFRLVLKVISVDNNYIIQYPAGFTRIRCKKKNPIHPKFIIYHFTNGRQPVLQYRCSFCFSRKEGFILEGAFTQFWSTVLAPVLVGIVVATYTYWLNHR